MISSVCCMGWNCIQYSVVTCIYVFAWACLQSSCGHQACKSAMRIITPCPCRVCQKCARCTSPCQCSMFLSGPGNGPKAKAIHHVQKTLSRDEPCLPVKKNGHDDITSKPLQCWNFCIEPVTPCPPHHTRPCLKLHRNGWLGRDLCSYNHVWHRQLLCSAGVMPEVSEEQRARAMAFSHVVQASLSQAAAAALEALGIENDADLANFFLDAQSVMDVSTNAAVINEVTRAWQLAGIQFQVQQQPSANYKEHLKRPLPPPAAQPPFLGARPKTRLLAPASLRVPGTSPRLLHRRRRSRLWPGRIGVRLVYRPCSKLRYCVDLPKHCMARTLSCSNQKPARFLIENFSLTMMSACSVTEQQCAGAWSGSASMHRLTNLSGSHLP